MRILVAIAATLLTAVPARARTWSLSECIDYALENNITVRQNTLSVQQRENDLNTARNRRLPGVSAGASQNISFGRGLTADNTYANTNTASTSFSLGADMTIFQGFAIKNNIAASRLNLEAATADLEKARDDIRVSVAQAYVQILYNKEILQVAENQIKVDSLQVERLTAMMDNGKASQAEVSAQKSTLARSVLSRTQAQNTLNLSVLDLTQLLELESPEGFDVEVPETDAFETGLFTNPEEIYAEAVAIKPSVRSELIRLENAETSIRMAKGNYLPSLSLNGGLGSNYYVASGRPSDSFGTQLNNNFSQYLGLSLSIPVFSRMSNRNGVRSAQLSYLNQQLQLDGVRKSLYKEIQQAYYSAVASEAKYISSMAAETSALESFQITEAKYESGMASITEFNESKGRWIEAASNLAQARYEYLYQTKLLDFYRGEKLSF